MWLIFYVQNVKSSYAVMGLVNEWPPHPETTLILLLRNALSSANFRIAHLGPWLSTMTSKIRLASLKFAIKILFSAKFDQLSY